MKKNIKYFPVTFLILVLTICTLSAKVKTEQVKYQQGNTILYGYLAYDDSVKAPRPGILVVHEWWGLNDYIKTRAEQLAGLGYVAFAVDMYGNGLVANSREKAAEMTAPFRKDRSLTRERIKAGLEVLLANKYTDKNRIAAIGYCFGGMVVLELARSGVNIKGVASFHGGLSTPDPADTAKIKCSVLVLHGAEDPNVPMKEVNTFEEEMIKAGIDWQIIIYGDAVHAFTNPASGNDKSKGAAYNEKADKRSWIAMQNFFKELFSVQTGSKEKN